jgi:hypothetical protein
VKEHLPENRRAQRQRIDHDVILRLHETASSLRRAHSDCRAVARSLAHSTASPRRRPALRHPQAVAFALHVRVTRHVRQQQRRPLLRVPFPVLGVLGDGCPHSQSWHAHPPPSPTRHRSRRKTAPPDRACDSCFFRGVARWCAPLRQTRLCGGIRVSESRALALSPSLSLSLSLSAKQVRHHLGTWRTFVVVCAHFFCTSLLQCSGMWFRSASHVVWRSLLRPAWLTGAS